MLKPLTRHGNSSALLIERPILELINADAETVFEITTDGTSLILTPVRNEKEVATKHASIERIGKRYRKSFEELAK